MNDSPGWASPGSPTDGEGSDGTQPPAQPTGGPKWSAEQPPPGQWSSPGTGAPETPAASPQQPQQGAGWGSYGGQQPGSQYGSPYGGQYGYPGGQGGPSAAKPGVIPLRPLGLGEILDGAVTTMRTHWRSVLSISLAVAVIVQLVSVLVQKYSMDELVIEPGSQPDAREVLDSIGSSMAVTLAALFIQLVGGILVTAMLTMVFSRAVLGQSSTVAGAWRESRGQLLRLAALTLLLGAGAVAAFTVLILPGVLADNLGLGVLGGFAALGLITWLWFKCSLASPALMLEKAKVFTALSRSSKLVKGSWWRIFGISLVTGILTSIVSAIIIWPLTLIGVAVFGGGMDGLADGSSMDSWGALVFAGIGSVIALTITMPMQSGVTVLLYIDQRIRREALDLELARAAGLENYGAGDHGTAPTPPSAAGGGPVTGG
ncbi:hypothetical protein [Streptomyces sp. ISL-86]|uniref:DUF7544 domain-containing protein n=1 Tax=Streptomyces sp. ISL-86 TaxID=2819187 RepID=UPI001BE97C56|nr:hypothetical protein [Streptomyces sp. ISL-86]MBT2459594.1 hypothetical protein [Streptomyces sp. ISL-86]